MIKSEFSSPIPGLSLDDQGRFYAEARRQQALTVAEYAGKAFDKIVTAVKSLGVSIVSGKLPPKKSCTPPSSRSPTRSRVRRAAGLGRVTWSWRAMPPRRRRSSGC